MCVVCMCIDFTTFDTKYYNKMYLAHNNSAAVVTTVESKVACVSESEYKILSFSVYVWLRDFLVWFDGMNYDELTYKQSYP